MRRLGIDIGSLYLKAAVIEDGRGITATAYREHRGNIRSELRNILQTEGFTQYEQVGISTNVQTLRGEFIDSMLAVIEGVRFLLPETNNIFAIGGETFSLILFDENGEYIEHSVNPPCASGTGSFIEQQAQRLSITPAELAQKASSYQGKTPSIATRCAVFAKTDIIHAMQEGYSLDAICAGLSEGIARSIVDVLVKGKELKEPIGIVGGVSLNRKLVAEIGEITGKQVIVPEYSPCAGAVGAARLGTSTSLELDSLFEASSNSRTTRPKLQLSLSDYPETNEYTSFVDEDTDVEVMLPPTEGEQAGTIEAFLGVDIGSTSTKAVLMKENGEVVGSFYTRTRGNPIEAVTNLLQSMDTHMGKDRLLLRGTATTGSGRKMIRELFRADFHVNEITAHAKAALHLHPQADTIIEIGGQDSKFTRIRGGDVYYSTMNYVCAAGTGSFIEEQAKRLGLSLEQFAELSFTAEAPFTSDRCTVYMERDLSELLAEGWPREALAAAVLNSVRDNYMAKVVNKSPLGDYIVFQGATARNRALVAAFEQLLEKPIHVSALSHVTGAMGAALLSMEENSGGSSFCWELDTGEIQEEVCDRCSNHCLLTVVERDGKKIGWGMKCGKEYEERQPVRISASEPEKRFKAAMQPLYESGAEDAAAPVGAGPTSQLTVGLPGAIYNISYAPLWHRFFSNLGISVVSTKPQKKAMELGKEIVNSDFCAPMILAHGYMHILEQQQVDFIFYPAIVNEHDPEQQEHLFKKKTSDQYFCYYSQYLPTIVSKLTSVDLESKLISPLLRFNSRTLEENARTVYQSLAEKIPGLDYESVYASFTEAYTAFSRRRERYARTYEQLQGHTSTENNAARKTPTPAMKVVLLGRPYVMFDPILNLGIPGKLQDYGVELYWMDEVGLEEFELTYANRYLERMHWHYGKQIIKLAEFSARTEDLFVVYLTCFRCSPDSFLLSYVKDIMTHFDKPFLVLQLDEHSSDVGYETRIEAGLHAFTNYLERVRGGTAAVSKVHARDDKLEKGDTVLIPYLGSIMSNLWADCFHKAGYQALLLSADEKSLNTGYQYANGGECMPLVSLIGSVIETVREHHLDPAHTFFYIPTVCMACNFPQFSILPDLAFDNAGLENLKIGLINNMAPGEIIGPALSMKMLEANIVGSILYKLYFRIKPYEVHAGQSDQILSHAKESLGEALRCGGDIKSTLQQIISEFKAVERDESGGRKPRIGIIGDLYVKYNEVVNQNVQQVVDELGGELIIPSLTEYPFHFYDADVRLFDDNPRPYKLLKTIEGRYEKLAEELIGEQKEPDFTECVELMEQYNIKHFIAGETSINIGRALYYLEHNLVDAILHINPIFCCPGVVTSSVYRKMQEDYGVPIIDIFYDGTGNPNRLLIPNLHYLVQKTTFRE